MEKRMVVVTTDTTRRGVFYGEFESGDINIGDVTLKNARMCVKWSSETKGVIGLAAIGPQKGSRITPPCKKITLNGVTGIFDCTDKAIEQWEKNLWD